jgi:hypothetical protein
MLRTPEGRARMPKSQLYLQLTEEFGGALFGPIVLPEYRLGSAEGNEVQLAEGLGVQAFHVRLIRKSGDTFYLAPVERSAAVWLYRTESRQPELLHGPTIVRPGDGFALVTPEGVRFQLVERDEERPRRTVGSAPAGGLAAGVPEGARRYGNRMVAEVWRRIRAAALATWFGRMLQNTWFFVRTGQIFSPVYVIGFLTMISGWGFGFRSCRANTGLTTQLTKAQEQRDDCRQDIQALSAGGTGGEADLARLAAQVHRDRTWERSLEYDALRESMKLEIKSIFQAPHAVDKSWFVGEANPYRRMVTRLTEAGLPEGTSRVLAWTAVNPFVEMTTRRRDTPTPEGTRPETWDVRRAADPAYRFCLRGPLGLSFNQAVRLGLDAAEDTFLDRRAASAQQGDAERGRVDDFKDDLLDRFNSRRGAVGLPPLTEDLTRAMVESVTLQEGTCTFRTLEDERTSYAPIATALYRHLGPDAAGLPADGQLNAVTARVVRLFLFELDGDLWANTDLVGSPLGAALTPLRSQDPVAEAHVADQAGKVLGRSIAIPCMLRIEEGEAAFPSDYMGQVPDFDTCAILMARAQFDRL